MQFNKSLIPLYRKTAKVFAEKKKVRVIYRPWGIDIIDGNITISLPRDSLHILTTYESDIPTFLKVLKAKDTETIKFSKPKLFPPSRNIKHSYLIYALCLAMQLSNKPYDVVQNQSGIALINEYLTIQINNKLGE